jgi:hypothetical protein
MDRKYELTLPTRENLRQFITFDAQTKRARLENDLARFSCIANDAILTSLSESKCFCTVLVSDDLLTAAQEYARQIERNECKCVFELRIDNAPVLPPPPPPPVVHCNGNVNSGGDKCITPQVAGSVQQFTQQRPSSQQWVLRINFLQMIL